MARATPADWIVYLPLLVLFVASASLRVEGDTFDLLIGAANARICLAESHIPCNRYVAHFPAFQYLFAIPALALDFPAAAVSRGLAWASLGFGVLAIVTYCRVGLAVAGVAGAHLALALLFSGYAVYYFFTSFNEMAAFALFATFAAAVFRRAHWSVVMSLAFLCCITKDIVAPFAAIVFVAARFAGRGEESAASAARGAITAAPAAIAGIIAAMALNGAFNWFRYASFFNLGILEPRYRAPPGSVTAYFAYLFISPAGGLAVAWLSLAAFAAAALVASRKRDADLVVMVLALCIVVGANVGLALWWSPFGWYAWGPRLTLPFLGAAVLLFVCRSGALLEALQAARYRLAAGVAIFAILLASMLPNVMAVAAADRFFQHMFAPASINRLLKEDTSTLEKAGAEVYMLAALETYGRNVVAPVTLEVTRAHPFLAVLAALYAALAAWRICRAPRQVASLGAAPKP